jgi:hypothetical protein
MYRWTVLLVALIFALIATVGCSGGGDSPVAPPADQGITDAVSHTGQTQTHLWGYWDVYMDLENMTVEAVPVRGATFAANVVQFLNGNPTALQPTIIPNLRSGLSRMVLSRSVVFPAPGLERMLMPITLCASRIARALSACSWLFEATALIMIISAITSSRFLYLNLSSAPS